MAVSKNKPTMRYYMKFINDPHFITPTFIILFVFEIILNIFIIERVNYTEIDWKAYMQEVQGFLNGTLDYQFLQGDTGPLVYPAGFVYFYSILYGITSKGTNIYLGQYIFLVLYLLQTLLHYGILKQTAKIPPYALVLVTMTSYRIHSIYVLRLFNDPIAVLFFYISLNLLIRNYWYLGSFFFSLAVSIKMNILLYAPCLLIAYLTNLTFAQTFFNLLICGLVQLFLALPFLVTNPVSYLKGSFDFGRIFLHKWTVNYRFLPIEIFENRWFHFLLLSIHILTLLLFTPLFKRYLSSYAKLKTVTLDVKSQLLKKRQEDDSKLSKKQREYLKKFEKQLSGKEEIDLKLEDRLSKVSQLFVLPFFVTNLIGMTFARSLHYQFYSWYYHSLIYLVFSTGFQKPFSFLLLAIIEFCWNVYPSTNLSSGSLHICHFVLLFGIYKTMKM